MIRKMPPMSTTLHPDTMMSYSKQEQYNVINNDASNLKSSNGKSGGLKSVSSVPLLSSLADEEKRRQEDSLSSSSTATDSAFIGKSRSSTSLSLSCFLAGLHDSIDSENDSGSHGITEDDSNEYGFYDSETTAFSPIHNESTRDPTLESISEEAPVHHASLEINEMDRSNSSLGSIRRARRKRQRSSTTVHAEASAAIGESIAWLCSHVPSCVHETLRQHVLSDDPPSSQGNGQLNGRYSYSDWYWDERPQEERVGMDDSGDGEKVVEGCGAEAGLQMPYAERHMCALLFVDISGFTKLSTLLDVESLSKAINAYFQMIVDEITAYNGDILKFAGDALFAEWRVDPDSSTDLQIQLEESVTVAAVCGAAIVKKCSDYPVYSSIGKNIGTRVSSLNVHCGIGAGEVASAHVGDTTKREFLIFGNPIDQVAEAEQFAKLGELVASPESLLLLGKTCDYPADRADRFRNAYVARSPCVIASKDRAYFVPRLSESAGGKLVTVRSCHQLTMLKNQCAELDLNTLHRLRDLLSLYVHPVVKNVEYAKYDDFEFAGPTFINRNIGIDLNENYLPKEKLQMRHRAEAELRTVYTMFIMPLIQAYITDDEVANQDFYNLLNNVLLITNRELERYHGHLRQFIVDDKGVVIIATFGLRGALFPNMVSEFSLPATIAIHNALQVELDLENHVGATVGRAYCGVVGGIRRHEFAVLGPSVNLAARLMASPHNPGILVDNSVRMLASKRYDFKALPPVKAKGYKDPVPIYEPIRALERQWGKPRRDLVGRERHISLIEETARELVQARSGVEMILITGDSGVGKSAVVALALEKVKNLPVTRRKNTAKSFRISLMTSVCSDTGRLNPLSAFRSIIWEMIHDPVWNTAVVTPGEVTFKQASQRSMMSDDISMSSQDLDHFSTAEEVNPDLDRLHFVSDQLEADRDIADFIGHHFLGISSDASPVSAIHIPIDDVLDFLFRIFAVCEANAGLLILAIDDIHHMDNLSWTLFELIYERAEKAMIVCTSLPLEGPKISAHWQQWTRHIQKMHETQQPLEVESTRRFCVIRLSCFNHSEVRQMAARAFCVDEENVDGQLCDDIYQQSRGMAHFANELLEELKNKHMVEFDPDQQVVGWKKSIDRIQVLDSFRSVEELILHRMDSLDAKVRTCLTLCAVLGLSFTFEELVMAANHRFRTQATENSASKEKKMLKRLKYCVDCAVAEGILREVIRGGFSEKGECSSADEITFTHELWRSSILKTMLESHKRDIHKSIAEALESTDGILLSEKPKNELEFKLKIFGHWRSGEEFVKAADLALKMGRKFDTLGMSFQCLRMYEEVMGMALPIQSLKFPKKSAMLRQIGPKELECLIRIKIEMAKCFSALGDLNSTEKAYRDAYEVFENCPAVDYLNDTTIIFPAFTGIIETRQEQHDVEYKENLCNVFVKYAKRQSDPIHLCRALALKSFFLFRIGRIRAAVEIHWRLEDLYQAEQHSMGISFLYGTDYAARNFSLCMQWNDLLGNEYQLGYNIDFLFSELIPMTDTWDLRSLFVLLFPALWVLKKRGMTSRAREEYERYMVNTFTTSNDTTETILTDMYKPILILFKLSEADESGNLCHDASYEELVSWILLPETGNFSNDLVKLTLDLGREGKSIIAEICLLLAKRTDLRKLQRCDLVKKGSLLAKESNALSAGNPAYIYSYVQSQKVLDELEGLNLSLGQVDSKPPRQRRMSAPRRHSMI